MQWNSSILSRSSFEYFDVQILKTQKFKKIMVILLYISVFWCEKKWICARGIMVIDVGNGHGDSSSNPGREWLHFT